MPCPSCHSENRFVLDEVEKYPAMKDEVCQRVLMSGGILGEDTKSSLLGAAERRLARRLLNDSPPLQSIYRSKVHLWTRGPIEPSAPPLCDISMGLRAFSHFAWASQLTRPEEVQKWCLGWPCGQARPRSSLRTCDHVNWGHYLARKRSRRLGYFLRWVWSA